jgi:hypothetical protein
MHAVFLVTATHLQHLQPHENGYQILALESLSKTLPAFRNSIAATSGSVGGPREALIACSMLLLQYSWTVNSKRWGSVLGLYRGLTETVFEFWDVIEGSPLTKMLSYSPRVNIERHLLNADAPADLEAIFSHCLACTRISDQPNGNSSDFIQPSRRLVTILHALSLGRQNLEVSKRMLDVARCLFSWPSLLPMGFIDCIRIEDCRAQVVMLYYFTAVSRLPSEKFWWMKDRAVLMCKEISPRLEERCEKCTSWAKLIFDEQDLT